MTPRLRAAMLPFVAGVCLAVPFRLASAQANPLPKPDPAKVATASSTVADRRVSVAILKSWVPFSTGSASLGGVAQAVLDDKAAILQLNPSLKIRIQSTGKDAAQGEALSLSSRRNEAVRAYLLANGVAPAQVIVAPVAGSDTRIGAGFDIDAAASDVTTLSIAALKQTPTVVRTRPGLEVFTLPRTLANDSVRILCAPPPAARFGVADASGVVSGPLLPKSLVFVARDSSKVFTLQHDVSLVADPDRIDMTKQLPDPRCK